jgi:hypothetical protein
MTVLLRPRAARRLPPGRAARGWMGYFASRVGRHGPGPGRGGGGHLLQLPPAHGAPGHPRRLGVRAPGGGAGGPVEGADPPCAPARRLGRGPEAAEAGRPGPRGHGGRDPRAAAVRRPRRPRMAGAPPPGPVARRHPVPRVPRRRPRRLPADRGRRRLPGHVLARRRPAPGSFLRQYRGWSEEEWAAARPASGAGWLGPTGPDRGRPGRPDAREPHRRPGRAPLAQLGPRLRPPPRPAGGAGPPGRGGGGIPFPNPWSRPSPAECGRGVGPVHPHRSADMADECTHLDQIRISSVNQPGCQDCLASGGPGSSCGCAWSAGGSAAATTRPTGTRPSTSRHRAPDHPQLRAGEDWWWCYVDELAFELEGAEPGPSRRVTGTAAGPCWWCAWPPGCCC